MAQPREREREQIRFRIGPAMVAALVILLAILFLPPSCFAIHTIVLNPAAVIQLDAPSGGARTLLALPDLGFIAGHDVLGAKILFTVPTQNRLTTFEVRPVATPWTSGAVTWDSPWSLPGGDFADNIFAKCTLFPSGHADGAVVIDATVLFQAYADGILQERGLLLRPLPNEGSGFGESISAALTSPDAIRIEITHEMSE